MAIPLVVVLNGARVTTTGNNQGSAAMDPAQCAPRAVYYSVTVTAPAILYVDTFGSSFDTHVGVRLQGTMATVGCNDNSCGGMQSQTTMVVPIGTHLIEVSGSAGALST